MLRDFFSDFLSGSELPENLNPFLSDAESSGVDGESHSQKEIDDDFVVSIGKVPGEEPYSIDYSDKTVTVDPKRGDWDGAREDLKEFWETRTRVFSKSAFELYLSIQANKGDVEEVCEFFEPILSATQYNMLKESYHTSIYFSEFNVSKDEENRRRRQLADNYGVDAMNIPSLCSAGYFEEEGVFRDVYHQLPEESKNEEYRELFDQLIRDRPFVVFVRGNNTIREIYDLIIRKSLLLDDLDVDIGYIHIRGIGEHPREKIQDVLDMVNENHDIKCVTNTNKKESGVRELVVAIDNETI